MAWNALKKLHVAGLSVIEGGLGAYVKAAGRTLKGKARLSLERQVRIAVGSLVLIGVVLGFFVHPGFLIVSAFVGTSLVFAGVTDWCGMGILLGRMPWNCSRAAQGAPGAGGTCAAAMPGACAAGAPPSGTCAAAPPDEESAGEG